MAEQTGIEWADSTFNPWMGCTKVSPACDHCYASVSTPARTLGIQWGPGQPRRRTSEANWKLPLYWERHHAEFEKAHGRRRRVFCASLADVFDNEVDPQWRADLFALIGQTPNLDWLLLTKRIGNVEPMVMDALRAGFRMTNHEPPTWPWTNVWLGATVVDQREADRDVPKLLATPAAVRFLSIEPMLGPVDLQSDLGGTLWIGGQRGCGGTHRHRGPVDGHDEGPGTSWVIGDPRIPHHHHDNRCGRGIDWVICGGESGPHARPMHPDRVRTLRDQCAGAGVPFMFKQWGEWAPWEDRVPLGHDWAIHAFEDGRRVQRAGKAAAGRLLDGVEHNGFPVCAKGAEPCA